VSNCVAGNAFLDAPPCEGARGRPAHHQLGLGRGRRRQGRRPRSGSNADLKRCAPKLDAPLMMSNERCKSGGRVVEGLLRSMGSPRLGTPAWSAQRRKRTRQRAPACKHIETDRRASTAEATSGPLARAMGASPARIDSSSRCAIWASTADCRRSAQPHQYRSA
jgi:hypothetical protein